MKEIGFGIMKNGKPCGIWPLSHEEQTKSVKRMIGTDSANAEGPFRYEIVPVGIGNPVGFARKAPTPDSPYEGESQTPESTEIPEEMVIEMPRTA